MFNYLETLPIVILTNKAGFHACLETPSRLELERRSQTSTCKGPGNGDLGDLGTGRLVSFLTIMELTG